MTMNHGTMPNADLTDREIDNICKGLTQNAAKVRFLQAMNKKLIVRRAADGRPLVNRAHYDAETGGGQAAKATTPAEEPAWDVVT